MIALWIRACPRLSPFANSAYAPDSASTLGVVADVRKRAQLIEELAVPLTTAKTKMTSLGSGRHRGGADLL